MQNVLRQKSKYNETLIISVGGTPQIVTETLWYYTFNKLRHFDKIVLITTATGKNKIKEELFNSKKLMDLEKALSVKQGTFSLTDENIIILKDSDGNELDDIRTSSDSEDMAKHVFEILRNLTEDQNSRLTIVIAGGRKTMPAVLALASSFYGREQDELVHVLINDELFWSDWFFPDNPNDPKQQIEVSHIPFLRLKNYTTGIKTKSPMEALSIAQTRLNELAPVAKVSVDRNKIIVDNNTFQLPPAEMQLWRYMARKKLENCKREDLKFCGSCNECYTPHSELVEEFDDKIADEYFCIVKEGSQAWDNRKEDINCRDIFDKDTRVRELKSKLKRNIKLRVNDPRLYHSFQIVDTILEDNELEKGFGFNLDKNAIIFEK